MGDMEFYSWILSKECRKYKMFCFAFSTKMLSVKKYLKFSRYHIALSAIILVVITRCSKFLRMGIKKPGIWKWRHVSTSRWDTESYFLCTVSSRNNNQHWKHFINNDSEDISHVLKFYNTLEISYCVKFSFLKNISRVLPTIGTFRHFISHLILFSSILHTSWSSHQRISDCLWQFVSILDRRIIEPCSGKN